MINECAHFVFEGYCAFESSTQHLVANGGGLFEIIHPATGFSYLQNSHFSQIVSIIMSVGSFIYVGAGFPASVCLWCMFYQSMVFSDWYTVDMGGIARQQLSFVLSGFSAWLQMRSSRANCQALSLNQNMRIIYMRKIAPTVKHCGLRQNMRIINGDGQSLRTLLSKILTLHFLEPPRFLCLTKNWSLRTHNNPSTLRTAHYFTPRGF